MLTFALLCSKELSFERLRLNLSVNYRAVNEGPRSFHNHGEGSDLELGTQFHVIRESGNSCI